MGDGQQTQDEDRAVMRRRLLENLAWLQRRNRYAVPDPPSRFVGVPFARLHVPRRRPGSPLPARG
jgi:hypothetical protein